MSKLEDIFIAKRAIEDIKKICSSYEYCGDCPLNNTGVCDWAVPTTWKAFTMFEEKR